MKPTSSAAQQRFGTFCVECKSVPRLPQESCWEIFEGVAGLLGTLLRAENQAKWRILAWLRPMVTGVVQVHVHLPGVRLAGRRCRQWVTIVLKSNDSDNRRGWTGY